MTVRYEYRVVWTRGPLPPTSNDPDDEGQPEHRARPRIYQTANGARRFLAAITHDFETLGLDPNAPWCCYAGDHECGCRGETNRQRAEREDRDRYGTVSHARIERREVGEWETFS